MVGSSASIACANYVLNTIVAESLDEICTRLEGSKDFDSEVLSIIHDTMRLHGRVIFNGNNYTDEWVSRAESLGLPNLRDTVAAAGAIVSPQSMAVLQKYHILTPVECEARYEIMLENYEKIIIIEANTMLEMAHRELLPAVVRSAAEAAQSAAAFAAAGVRSTRVPELAQTLATAADRIANAADRLAETVENAPGESPHARARLLCARYHKTDDGIPARRSGRGGNAGFKRKLAGSKLYRSAASGIRS